MIVYALFLPICTQRVPYDGTPSHLPVEILKLENHMGEPPIISNINKRRQELSKKPKSTSSVDQKLSDQMKKALNFRDIGDTTVDELEHNYAEGLDFTLTDLVLFPCVSCLLVSVTDFFHISKLVFRFDDYRWYFLMLCFLVIEVHYDLTVFHHVEFSSLRNSRMET